MGLKLAILISGRGSNMQAIHRAIEEKRLDAEIKLVLSDQASAAGLQYAIKHHIPTELITKQKGELASAYSQRLIAALAPYQPDLIVLAGFMRILGGDFIHAFENKIVNIHPSILPAFPGLHAQAQALQAGVKYSGCTVHFVDEGCDTGAIIDQRIVPVLPGDTEESLSERILAEEHKLYTECLQKIAENKIRWGR